MDVKGTLPSLLKIDQKARVDEAKSMRTDATNKDRDGNGRQEQKEEERKTHLTAEEMERVLKHLRTLPGVLANSLTVTLEGQEGSARVVYIRDLQGRTIRRISEPDLWALLRDQDRKTGQILDKAG